MGFVYRVKNRSDGRESALKLLPTGLAAVPAFVERFEREARTLARLHHPNIVAVHGFGRAGEFCYLLMEFVDGANLRQAMQTARFSPAETLALVPQLCDALQYAHAHGVLHRDIKPENILLDPQGVPRIADFGIAKLLGDPNSPDHFTLTQTGQRVGTPHYMAPEQIEKPDSVDHRADIYSLGVVLYELLTGELPLGRFPAPSVKAALDARIDEIVFRALSKERELRQQSASQVRQEVESLESKPATPTSASVLRSSDCYLSSASHLQSWRGLINIYSDRGTLRLESGQLVFISAGETRIIPFAHITGLAIGEYPKFMKPTGLEYIAVRFTSKDSEQTLFFTPHQSRWAPTWDTNVVVQDWERSLRDAIAASGLQDLPRIDRPGHAGARSESFRFGLMTWLPGIAGLVSFLFVLFYNATRRNGKEGLIFLFLMVTFALMGGVAAVLFAMRMARSRKGSGQGTPAPAVFLVILLAVIAPLTLGLIIVSPISRAPVLPQPTLASAGPARPQAAPAAETVPRLLDLSRQIQAAANRVGCLPPSLRTFGLTATDPSSHRPFIYLGGNPNRQSPILAFAAANPDSGSQAVLKADGSVVLMTPEDLAPFFQFESIWVHQQIQNLQANGPLSLDFINALPAWATQGIPIPPNTPLSDTEARALQAWGTTIVYSEESRTFNVANGSLPEVFWTATDEVSRTGKPTLALDELNPFLEFLQARSPGGVRFEFILAGHQYRISNEGLAAVGTVLAAHAGDVARLQLSHELLGRIVGTHPDTSRDITLFERFKPGEEKQLTEVVRVNLGSLLRAEPTEFLFPKIVRKTPDHPEGSTPESAPTPWLPRR